MGSEKKLPGTIIRYEMKPIKIKEIFSLKIQIVRKKKCWELGHFEVSQQIRYEKVRRQPRYLVLSSNVEGAAVEVTFRDEAKKRLALLAQRDANYSLSQRRGGQVCT